MTLEVDDATVAAAGKALTARLAAEADVTDVMGYWQTGSPAMRSTPALEWRPNCDRVMFS